MIHHTTKYDNSLHYIFETEIQHQSGNTLAVYTPSGTPLDSYRGKMETKTHILMFYFADRNYNIHIHWQPDWTPKMHYVNIASKARWNESKVSAVDLDLDLIRHAGNREIILDDEDEFQENRKRYSYPDTLVEQCWKDIENLSKEMEKGEGIWSHQIFNWRPGSALPDFCRS